MINAVISRTKTDRRLKMPILIFLSNFLGQPVVVTIVPAQMPRIEFVAPVVEKATAVDDTPAGCRYLVCKA